MSKWYNLQKNTQARSSAAKYCVKIDRKILPEKEAREIDDPANYFARAYEYYIESKARPGEMIGATGAANVGEPVTQAGLRAFHGGGKGTVPTTDRIIQVLDLSRSPIQQPVTQFYLERGVQ